MRIGLIDVDMESRGKCTFPNLSLMKISAYQKAKGHHVEWYDKNHHYDVVFMSKVFSDEYTHDYTEVINADSVIRGGSGYAIQLGEDGKEFYKKELDPDLPYEIEHCFPDYSLYEPFGITDTAYGFLTKGCPRGCDFCHVKSMQGRNCRNHCQLSEFWNGQKQIVLLDPNLTAHPDCVRFFNELADTGATVDFSQGLDIQFLTEEKVKALNRVKFKRIHFAWDRPSEDLRSRFALLPLYLDRCSKSTISVYCLTNFNSTHEQDMHRIMYLRSLKIQPYVMIYRKPTAPAITRRLQRWVNWSPFFWKFETFEEYQTANYKEVLY